MKDTKLQKYALSLTNERLRLTILPTEQCNFRCYYCWEDFQHGKMAQSTIEGIKNLLRHRAKTLKLLQIEWFGGEPLLAKDVIIDISTYIKNLCAENPNLQYIGGITTNGYFLDFNTFENLCSLGIKRYYICLDGLKEIHDKTRFLANGDGTFDVIWNNLEKIRESKNDFSITLTISYFKDNYLETILPLLQKLEEEFGKDKRFFIFFKSIQRLGNKNDCDIKIVSQDEDERIRDEMRKYVKKLQTIKFIYEDYVCYAAELNTMLIRANGNIGKCIVALKEEHNNVGKINVDGTLNIDNQKYMLWSKGFQSLDEKYLSCPNKFVRNITLNNGVPDTQINPQGRGEKDD